MNELQESFAKQGHGLQNWLRSYKMEIYFPELYQDLRQFHRRIRGEVLRVIQNESNALGPLKFKLTVLLILKKRTNRGEEEVTYFTRQENSTILQHSGIFCQGYLRFQLPRATQRIFSQGCLVFFAPCSKVGAEKYPTQHSGIFCFRPRATQRVLSKGCLIFFFFLLLAAK